MGLYSYDPNGGLCSSSGNTKVTLRHSKQFKVSHYNRSKVFDWIPSLLNSSPWHSTNYSPHMPRITSSLSTEISRELPPSKIDSVVQISLLSPISCISKMYQMPWRIFIVWMCGTKRTSDKKGRLKSPKRSSLIANEDRKGRSSFP